MVTVGAVSADNADDPYKVKWQRAARTDAGVHALANVISAQLCLRPGLVEKLNEVLPPTIRIWDIVRVQNGFNSHTFCEARYYSYTFPTYLLQPSAPGSHLHAHVNALPHPTEPQNYVPDEARFDYRVTPELLQKLRSLTQPFVGRHFFHNFTADAAPGEKDTRRTIHSITIGEPFVRNGLEWITVTLHAQSFILHQIRKMAGALLLCTRTDTPAIVLRALMDRRAPGRTHVPRAPAPGLILERPVFDGYSRKLVEDPKPNAVARAPVSFEPFAAQQEAFREELLWPSLLEKEAEFAQWMLAVDAYDGDDLEYLGPQGAALSVDPPPPDVDDDRPVSSVDVLDGRARFSYFVEGEWVRTTIPVHVPGWRRRRFMDRIADKISTAGSSTKEVAVGVESEVDERATGEVGWAASRAAAEAYHQAVQDESIEQQ